MIFESQKYSKCKEKDTNSYILYNSISVISEKGQITGLEIISDR